MTDINVSFCRQLLKQLAPEVKAINPQLNVWRGKEWVHHNGRQDWEFHGPDEFYWHGRADNAFDARYKGWSAWIEKQQRRAAEARVAIKPFRVSVDWITYAHEPGAESGHALAKQLCEMADDVPAPASRRSAYVLIPGARADLVREVIDVAGLYSGRTRGVIWEEERRITRNANLIIKRGREWLRTLDELTAEAVQS